MSEQLLPRHIIIDVRILQHFEISYDEYLLVYIVDDLSNSVDYPWCLATRDELAEMVKVSRRTIMAIIKRMEEKGLIERDSNNSLRSSKLWRKAQRVVVTLTGELKKDDDRQNLPTQDTESNSLIQNDGRQKLHTIHINTNTLNIKDKPLTGNGITVNSKPLTDNPHTTPIDTPDSKHAIVPLTQMDKYTMAKELGVAFPVVVETEKRFWEYIEEPKNRKKYKTSYKTIRKWIEMKLEKGELSPANEVEILDIERHHPDEVAKLQKALEILKKQGRI